MMQKRSVINRTHICCYPLSEAGEQSPPTEKVPPLPATAPVSGNPLLGRGTCHPRDMTCHRRTVMNETSCRSPPSGTGNLPSTPERAGGGGHDNQPPSIHLETTAGAVFLAVSGVVRGCSSLPSPTSVQLLLLRRGRRTHARDRRRRRAARARAPSCDVAPPQGIPHDAAARLRADGGGAAGCRRVHGTYRWEQASARYFRSAERWRRPAGSTSSLCTQ